MTSTEEAVREKFSRVGGDAYEVTALNQHSIILVEIAVQLARANDLKEMELRGEVPA